MGNEITSKKLYFMRHGAILGDRHSYEKMKYQVFMEYLTGKKNETLQPSSSFILTFQNIFASINRFLRQEKLSDEEIELRKYQIHTLPQKIDEIYHSPSSRTRHTAKLIQRYFPNKPKIVASQKNNLAEVKFSENLLTEEEFNKRGGLKGCRPLILEKWFDGRNKESVTDSLNRLKKLLNYVLFESPHQNILFITHAWYMRIVFMYFEGQSIELENLLKAPIPNFGQMFEYSLELNGESTVVKSPRELKPVKLDLAIEKN